MSEETIIEKIIRYLLICFAALVPRRVASFIIMDRVGECMDAKNIEYAIDVDMIDLLDTL